LGAATISKAWASSYIKGKKYPGSKLRKEINMDTILVEIILMVLRIVLPVAILLGVGEIVKRKTAKRGNI
jgi:hypothetical protein